MSVDTNSTDSADSADRSAWRRHRDILLLSVVVVCAAFLLTVEEPRVRLRVWPHWLLPESCVSRNLFGIECPLCGLTRSFVYLADGEFVESLAANRVGWVPALAIALQVPFRIVLLVKRNSVDSPKVRHAVGWTIVLILISNWVYNLIS